MNTLLFWALPLFSFLISLALTSVVGLACYAVGRRINHQVPDVMLAIGFLVGVIDVCLILSNPLAFVFTLVIVIICSMGTFAERAAHPTEQSWGLVLLRMCLTTVCSVAVSFPLLLACAVSSSYSWVSNVFSRFWFPLGGTVGMLFSPSVIPSSSGCGRAVGFAQG